MPSNDWSPNTYFKRKWFTTLGFLTENSAWGHVNTNIFLQVFEDNVQVTQLKKNYGKI